MKQNYEIICVKDNENGYILTKRKITNNMNEVKKIFNNIFDNTIIEESKQTTFYNEKMAMEARDIYGFNNVIIIKKISGFAARKRKGKNHNWYRV